MSAEPTWASACVSRARATACCERSRSRPVCTPMSTPAVRKAISMSQSLESATFSVP